MESIGDRLRAIGEELEDLINEVRETLPSARYHLDAVCHGQIMIVEAGAPLIAHHVVVIDSRGPQA